MCKLWGTKRGHSPGLALPKCAHGRAHLKVVSSQSSTQVRGHTCPLPAGAVPLIWSYRHLNDPLEGSEEGAWVSVTIQPLNRLLLVSGPSHEPRGECLLSIQRGTALQPPRPMSFIHIDMPGLLRYGSLGPTIIFLLTKPAS